MIRYKEIARAQPLLGTKLEVREETESSDSGKPWKSNESKKNYKKTKKKTKKKNKEEKKRGDDDDDSSSSSSSSLDDSGDSTTALFRAVAKASGKKGLDSAIKVLSKEGRA